MPTATIEKLDFVETFESRHGPLECYRYVFSNGIDGQANHKRKPNWGPGDEVDFEVTGQTPNGERKLKVSKPQAPASRAPQPAGPPYQPAPPDFHKEMKKLSLFWCHCFQYVADIESHIGELTADQRQSAIASLFIEGNKHGLSQNPPALRKVEKVEDNDPY